jgi:hypothetical protein
MFIVKQLTVSIAAIVLGSFSLMASAARCGASVEPHGAHITREGDVFSSFSVSPNQCANGCRGQVDFRVYYSSRGGTHFYSSGFSWSASAGETVRISKQGYELYCSETHLGPCEVQQVEIVEADCSVR